jgi:hypothetical protein
LAKFVIQPSGRREFMLTIKITSNMMTAVSLDSFQKIWDAPENEHWDDFIKDRLKCTNKEI